MRVCLVLWAGLLCGCDQSDFGGGPGAPGDPQGPGTPAWDDDEVSCDRQDQCHSGEVCQDGVCQPQRCGDVELYRSLPPVGQQRVFFLERELAVAGESAVDGYAPDGSGSGSWSLGARIVDVAGGSFTGERPESVAVAVEGSRDLEIPALGRRVDAGIVPKAIAAGDVDRDGLDEIVAISASGQVAVCDVELDLCEPWSAGGVGLDVTVGDVDGDSSAESVFLIEGAAGTHRLVVWNRDAMTTGDSERLEAPLADDLVSISAGDHDADGRAEVVGLEDGGYYDWVDDTLHVYRVNGLAVSEIGSLQVDWESLDIAHADLDADRRDELMLLRQDPLVEIFRASTAGFLASESSATPASSQDPRRITSVDLDGDSPAGRLVEGPTLVPGEIVPTIVLYMPPYYKSRSPGTPWIWLGDQTNTSTSVSDTVGLDIGVTLGVDVEFPVLFEAELASTLSTQIEQTRSVETEIVVGDQFFIEADPELYGEDYAAVVLSCGCFHSYVYEMDDPSSMTGADGRRFAVLVPVGGQTTMWSSKRYNAMARALGGLPEIEVPHQVGDVSSYPSQPQRADGSPIPVEDLLFPDVPTVRVSDVGEIGWGLIRTELQTNEVATSTALDVEGSVSVVGFTLGGHAGLSWGEGYAVTIGDVAEFLGAVPAIPDDPHTPEDEYETYAYSLQPHVYRQPYADRAGHQAAYYVLNYSVGD